MHYARPILDRRGRFAFVAASIGIAAAAVSCGDGNTPNAPVDASDANAAPETAQTNDAGLEDVVQDAHVQPFDGGPSPVVCTSNPCAKELVTTRGANAVDLAEGFCALLQDGTVACWGANGAGQLGRDPEGGVLDSATAARVSGLTNIVSLEHTCAIDESGAAYCWGTGPFLRSPTVATTTERTPVKLDIPSATKVAIGAVAGCAVSEGRVLCWGSNVNAQIAPFHSQPASAVLSAKEIALPPGAPIRDVVVGDATFAIREDGSVVSWGANPPLARLSSLVPDPYPMTSALTDVMTLDVADHNACSTSAGSAFCWGTIIPRASEPPQSTPRLERALPARVETPEPVVQIATTRSVVRPTAVPPILQPQRWCAVGASGAVYCWGYNAGGQAGDGTVQHAYEPVKVTGLPGPAAQVRTTPGATCALLVSGKVYCWGTNFYGQLGNGAIKISSLTPGEVALP